MHRKGNEKICNNGRRKTTKDTVEQFQCIFTVVAINIAKQLIGKTHEQKIKIKLVFIDFQQVFGSLKKMK